MSRTDSSYVRCLFKLAFKITPQYHYELFVVVGRLHNSVLAKQDVFVHMTPAMMDRLHYSQCHAHPLSSAFIGVYTLCLSAGA